MAFFRFNRDKRGYEHFYLVEPVTNRRGKSRTRVLYWYRTPPNIRVGRAPFDEDVQRALEAQNPTVAFDWRKIIDAPIPSADVEKWRERRRVERAEKGARRFTPAAEEPLDDNADRQASVADPELSAPIDEALTPEAVATSITMTATPPTTVTSVSAVTSGGGAESIRKRRRRRRGRGPRPGSPQTVASATADAPQQTVQTSAPSEPAQQIDTTNPTETPGD